MSSRSREILLFLCTLVMIGACPEGCYGGVYICVSDNTMYKFVPAHTVSD